jgi:hypothetical protein
MWGFPSSAHRSCEQIKPKQMGNCPDVKIPLSKKVEKIF